jgi:hypothetical protein
VHLADSTRARRWRYRSVLSSRAVRRGAMSFRAVRRGIALVPKERLVPLPR